LEQQHISSAFGFELTRMQTPEAGKRTVFRGARAAFKLVLARHKVYARETDPPRV
jgi:hypothetical protein